jgi:hypothetical protein
MAKFGGRSRAGRPWTLAANSVSHRKQWREPGARIGPDRFGLAEVGAGADRGQGFSSLAVVISAIWGYIWYVDLELTPPGRWVRVLY